MLTIFQKTTLKSALLETLSGFYDTEFGIDISDSLNDDAQAEIEQALDVIVNVDVSEEEEEE